MSPDPEQMSAIAGPFETVSDKIRALDAAGYARADIARFLGKRYQHIRNVLVDDAQRQGGYTLGRAELRGVGEAPSPYDAGQTDRRYVQPRGGGIWRLVVRADGSVFLPVEVMQALGLSPGSGVIAKLDGQDLILNDGSAALKELQDLVMSLVPPDVSLVDELIADRRREAEREDSGG